jgi:hypothetical protein
MLFTSLAHAATAEPRSAPRIFFLDLELHQRLWLYFHYPSKVRVLFYRFGSRLDKPILPLELLSYSREVVLHTQVKTLPRDLLEILDYPGLRDTKYCVVR